MSNIKNAEWPNSSNLARASYSQGTSQLLVEFKNGGRYVYDGIPEVLWEGLLLAPSAGSFLSLNIKGNFQSRKLDPGEDPSEINNWRKAIDNFLSFSIPTFAEATAFSSMVKLEEEGNEVCDIIAGKDGELDAEYADCLMCIFDSAKRAGIDPDQILQAFIKKTEKNKTRVWIKSEDNTYSHT